MPELMHVGWQVYALTAGGLAIIYFFPHVNKSIPSPLVAILVLTAGVMLLFMVVFLSDWVSRIPMAALVSVMIMVSIGTFSFDSLKNMKTHPLSSNIVMLTTVFVVVATHNLAYGVFVGVVIASLFFAHKVGRLVVVISSKDDDTSCRTYKVRGQIFFASSEQFFNAFDIKERLDKVIIDVSEAHFWDITAVSTLDKIVNKFRNRGAEVDIIGKNEASATIIELLAVHNKPEKIKKAIGAH